MIPGAVLLVMLGLFLIIAAFSAFTQNENDP